MNKQEFKNDSLEKTDACQMGKFYVKFEYVDIDYVVLPHD